MKLMTDADRDPVMVTPNDNASTHYDARNRGGCVAADCREARRRCEGGRQGVRGGHRYRCENEGGDYCQTKENVNKLDCFHTDDPPLIVEIILEV